MVTYDYIKDFYETATIVIRGSEHKLSSPQIDVVVKVPNVHGLLIPYFLAWTFWVDPHTHDVTVRLMSNRHRGIVILTGHAS